MGDLILGIDIGTTGTKCTIYNYSGEIAASAYQDYPMIHPQLNSNRIQMSGGAVSEVICINALKTTE